MDRSSVLANLFDEKTVKILEKLLLKKDIFYLRELSKESGVSLATTYRIVQKLLTMGLAEKTQHGKFTIYKLKRNSLVFTEIYNIIVGQEVDPIEYLQKTLKETLPKQPILLYILNDGNKVFIIGDVPAIITAQLSSKIHEKTGTKLELLAVSSDQFSKMQEMGLISAGKAINIH